MIILFYYYKTEYDGFHCCRDKEFLIGTMKVTKSLLMNLCTKFPSSWNKKDWVDNLKDGSILLEDDFFGDIKEKENE